MALVHDLWRCDSWANPLMGCGAGVLTLLRTESEAGFASAAGVTASQFESCGNAAAKLRAAAVLRGTASRTQPRAQSRLSSFEEPAFAASRAPAPAGQLPPSSARQQLSPRPAPAGPTAASADLVNTGKPGAEARPAPPDLPMSLTMGVDLLGEEPLPPKLWDDDVLPEETAWLFDPAADPLSECTASVLDELAGPYGCGSICEPAEEAAGSPVSVFYQDSDSCHSDTHADELNSDCQESAKPECSDASGATAVDSALDSSCDLAKDDAFGPSQVFLPAVLDEEESPAPAAATRKRTRAPETHAEPEPAAITPAPVETPPAREPSSRASKKSRRAPPPVPKPAAKPAPLPKGKGRQSCVQCFTMSTPQWREGPQGARTLCNACGVRYRKQLNLAKKALKGSK
mmetsp:Transcript_44998/g.113921  ORF Transcript_44998/g.113921 Transcript_44998/m.113921 type:complete len:402 (+) Transcript_44998:114-1319(+)|eukprot:jgi/Tetstr1/429638/TSEL_019536.t1